MKPSTLPCRPRTTTVEEPLRLTHFIFLHNRRSSEPGCGGGRRSTRYGTLLVQKESSDPVPREFPVVQPFNEAKMETLLEIPEGECWKAMEIHQQAPVIAMDFVAPTTPLQLVWPFWGVQTLHWGLSLLVVFIKMKVICTSQEKLQKSSQGTWKINR